MNLGNQENKARDQYEGTEKLVVSWVYLTCTDRCLGHSKTHEINAKEKNCLTHCYDATLWE